MLQCKTRPTAQFVVILAKKNQEFFLNECYSFHPYQCLPLISLHHSSRRFCDFEELEPVYENVYNHRRWVLNMIYINVLQ